MLYAPSGIIKKLDSLGRSPIPDTLSSRWENKEVFITLNKEEALIIIESASSNEGSTEINFSRKIDSFKRIVIPVDIRRALRIGPGDELEILSSIEHPGIALQPVLKVCAICHNKSKVLYRMKKDLICESCIEHIKAL